jgi:hypothetical protein
LNNIAYWATALYFRNPRLSQCGRLMPWLDSAANIVTSTIEPREFPSNSPPDQYWPRRIFGFEFNLGRIIRGNDYPMDAKAAGAQPSTYPLAEHAEEAIHAAEELMAEARAQKKGTIPAGAILQMRIGPFEYFEMHELGEVFLVGRTIEGHFGILWIDPYRGTFHCEPADLVRDDERRAEVIAALWLWAAAVVRDFWVVEEREAVFRETQSLLSIPRPPANRGDRPRIVYLPRVRYTHHPNISQCGTALGIVHRRAHNVRPHIRRSGHCSAAQMVLAERYGFEMPTGYTFVRPHERGKVHRDVIYRSRSALQLLYTVASEESTGGPSQWFRFEKDVYRLMEAFGFDVQHIAASKRGDRGVDVYATKGRDLEQVNWVIQCKCYGPKHPVGPNIIRELIGTLQGYPRGTRGMVVTTSRFTSGAVAAGEAEQIRLIGGEEFVSLLRPPGGSENRTGT